MSSIIEIETKDLVPYLTWVPIILLAYPAWRAIYNVFLHPLSEYPGPVLASGCKLYLIYYTFIGRLHSKLKEIHDRHGDVVRIAPNMLAYRNPQAWKDICGHRKHGTGSFLKDPEFFPDSPSGPMLLSVNDADHSRQRRLLAHAFSDKALREQEPVLQSYVDLLVKRLKEEAVASRSVDMTQWFNYITFDVIGDLSFGESFVCLENRKYHRYVQIVFESVKASALIRNFQMMLPGSLVNAFMPKRLRENWDNSFNFTKDRVHRRMNQKTTRPDFMTYILRHNDERGMTIPEIESIAGLLTIAGSETTGSVLSGLTYYLLKNPDTLKKLVEEIRGTFKREEDIKFLEIGKLPYLNAVIEESMRMYPPVPAIIPRSVPAGGSFINGLLVPEGTSVTMAYFSAFRASTNFAEAESFIPERWLLDNKDPRFASDKREVLQPFSYGPRNCLGKNLAYAEMRLIAAKIVWNFDMNFESKCDNWDDQISYNVWQKKPLMIRLSPAQR